MLLLANLTTLGSTKFRVVSADIYWSYAGHTAAEGPLEVGIANGDLSVAEVAECLDSNPTSQSDIVAREFARRPVRRSGVFDGVATIASLNDGKSIRTKLNTILDEGTELKAWIKNLDASALTTGTLIKINGAIYGYWI